MFTKHSENFFFLILYEILGVSVEILDVSAEISDEIIIKTSATVK